MPYLQFIYLFCKHVGPFSVISASEVYPISSSAREADNKSTVYSLHLKSKKRIWVKWEER